MTLAHSPSSSDCPTLLLTSTSTLPSASVSEGVAESSSEKPSEYVA
ncbi:MAG: hypothetical protein QW035_03785 [Candidatus Anstonellales archaeon]